MASKMMFLIALLKRQRCSVAEILTLESTRKSQETAWSQRKQTYVTMGNSRRLPRLVVAAKGQHILELRWVLLGSHGLHERVDLDRANFGHTHKKNGKMRCSMFFGKSQHFRRFLQISGDGMTTISGQIIWISCNVHQAFECQSPSLKTGSFKQLGCKNL